MTVWTNTKGTQTAVISTEHTLTQNSNANTFQFSVDTTNMVNGDITELRVYRIVNASAIQIACGIYANVQSSPLKEYKFTASQGVANGIKVTLKQTAGTGRNFDWELLADGGTVAANVLQWNSTNVSSPATAGIPDVNVKNINNVAAATPGASGGILISGSNSGTTTLAALTVTGSFTISDGLLVSRSSANTSAITATGNGTGSGLVATSGSGVTGDGIQATSVATNGNGYVMTGKGTGNALKLVSISGDALLTSVSTSGHGATFAGTGTTKHGINATGGATTSHGIVATGGGVGHGILATSGSGATGDGIKAVAASTNGNGLNLVAVGTGAGLLSTGGATGQGSLLIGGATSGEGLKVTTTSGDGFLITPTAGNAIVATANGTSKHGIVSTGGTAGTSDGIKAVAGTGGVDIRGAITGNITGNLSGSVGSVTAAVTSNVTQWSGTNVSAPATAGIPEVNIKNINNVSAGSVTTVNANQGTTQPLNFTGTAGSALVKSDMVDIAGAAVSTSSAQIGVNVVAVAGAASNFKKNQALPKFEFLMTDSTTHAPKTGLTVTSQVSLDGGAFAAATNSAVELSNGVYYIDLAAADMNGNTVMLRFTSAGADDRLIEILTQP